MAANGANGRLIDGLNRAFHRGMAGEGGDIKLKLKLVEQAADESRHTGQLTRMPG